MTVLIAGGGIGGLTLALSLHQIGVSAKIFESVPELKPLGVGINVLPHAVRELIELGLHDRLDAAGVRTRELAYFSKHGKPIWSEPRGIEAGYKWPQFRHAFEHFGRNADLVQAERQRQPADAAARDENRHATPPLLPGRHRMREGRGQLRRAGGFAEPHMGLHPPGVDGAVACR